MAKLKIGKPVVKQIDQTVKFFETKYEVFEQQAKNLHDSLLESAQLRKLLHSTKVRAKSPERLRDKLKRKAEEALQKGKPFRITPENLFEEIEDLAGVRLLHLHTSQMGEIHPLVLSMLKEHKYKVFAPIAYTWDIEYEHFFKEIGIRTVDRDTLYTSVHYVVQPSRRTAMRCELQVRTLMEEIWGEVSHKINYPHESESIACREQLKVLARVTSSCTRLVDSIFDSDTEHKSLRADSK